MKDIFWQILTILSISVDWFVLKVVFDNISSKKTKGFTIYLELVSIIFIIFFFSKINLSYNIKLLIGIILSFLFIVLNYDISKLKGFLINILYWLILIGIDAIGVSFVTVLNSLNKMDILLQNNVVRLELILFTKIILLMIIPIIEIKKIKVHIKTKDSLYLIMPILTNIISIVSIFWFVFRENYIDFKESILILLISVIFIISNLSLILIIIKIIKNDKINMENKIIKEKMDMQYKYYLSLNESKEAIKKMYHDINNHITCLKNISDEKEIVEKYIDEIKTEISGYDSFNTGNLILDAILNDKKIICEKEKIDFIVDIKLIDSEFIEMIDICSIFSNILDNAIEACKKINDINVHKFIKIRTTKVKNFLVIKCKNSKINEIILKEGKILTDKKDSFNHGIGISSIKSSVEKYNGGVNIDVEDDYFLITIFIPIQS